MNLVGNRLTMILDIQGSVIATLRSEAGMMTEVGCPGFQENARMVTGTFRYTGRRFRAETAGSAAQPSGFYYTRSLRDPGGSVCR